MIKHSNSFFLIIHPDSFDKTYFTILEYLSLTVVEVTDSLCCLFGTYMILHL